MHRMEGNFMDNSIALILSIVAIKITAIIIGYQIVKLGHDALTRGIKGEFDFGGKVDGKLEFKLISASPGLFFVLFGSFIIVWALYVEKPVSWYSHSVTESLPATPDANIGPLPMEDKQ